jgi:hypothetical protein
MISSKRRLLLVAIYVGVHAAFALALAAPLASLFGRALGHYPDIDRALLEPGGVMFIEALRVNRAGIAPAMGGVWALALVAGVVSIVPFGVLVAGLAGQGRERISALFGRAFESFGVLALLWAIALVAQVVVLSVLVLVLGKVATNAPLSPVGSTIATALSGLLAVLGASVVGVAHDLARVAAVTEDASLLGAIKRAWATLGPRPYFAYLWRAALALLVVAVAAWIAPPLAPVGAPPVALAFLLHQVAVMTAALLRASWLDVAIKRLRDRPPVGLSEPEPAPEEPVVAAPEPAPQELVVAPEAPLVEAAIPAPASEPAEPEAAAEPPPAPSDPSP